jgi:hypothetical protein
MNDILPIFSSHYSLGEASILTTEEPGKSQSGNPVSIFDLAVEGGLKKVIIADDRMDGFVEAQKASTKAQVQFVFGLRLVICADMADKTDGSRITESKVIVFVKDSEAYIDLLKINNRAWTTGRFGYGRLDWRTLRELWTDRLMLALPFWSSFLQRNTLTMSSITPDLPCTPTVFKEVDTQLPFESLINDAIDLYVATNPAPVQRVKSIYYAGSGSSTFEDYTIFRARGTRSKGKSGTFSAPGVDDLASDRFSWAAYQELTT